jgi:2'-aminobiphenyl-2,3-diol 1,2-dioxygenase, small subunit
MNTPAASPVNALLARLFQEPELLQRLRTDPDIVFASAGLTPMECAALRDGSFGALDRIGVHPTLRMHYQMAIKPEIAEHVTVRDFLPALMEERRHG